MKARPLKRWPRRLRVDNVTGGVDRRSFLQGAAGSLLPSRDDDTLLQRLPGARLLSAGMSARRGDGRVALRAIDGRALRGDGAQRAEMTFDRPFRVASVSKMVTATGFMRLVAAGAVRSEERRVGKEC